ncbi:MAG: hypothetical protein KAT25_02710 [Sulfuriflexus sp.]|nr:hypothetical protein [Sulfuriflexus sp.]
MERTTHHFNGAHLLALATILLISLSPLAQADIGVGAIVIDSQIEGKGDFETNGGIKVGDTITTGAKGNVTILFDDESMLTLGPNAKAQVVKFSETPAPGVSEIKIISGGFRYFPGIILENGGKQVLNNIGGTSTAGESNNTSGPDIALNTDQPLNDDLNGINEQLTDISSLLSDVGSEISFQTPDTGSNITGGGVTATGAPNGNVALPDI